jgi:hypothetical protein
MKVRHSIRRAAAASALLTVSACGGGGGSGPGPTIVPFVIQPAGTTVTYPINSASVATTNGVVTGSRIDQPGAGGTFTVTTDGSGNVSAVQFNVATPTSNFTLTNNNINPTLGGLNLLANILYSVNTNPGSTGYFRSGGNGVSLSYSSYGGWASNDGGTGLFGVFAFGSMTPPASMPVTGTATYSGSTIGIAASATNSYAFNGTVQLQANFANSTVGTTVSNLQFQDTVSNTVTSQPNLTGSATITGNQYSGTLSGGTLIGTSTGTFYGPAANETAGVWRAAGGGLTAVGSYGATR